MNTVVSISRCILNTETSVQICLCYRRSKNYNIVCTVGS